MAQVTTFNEGAEKVQTVKNLGWLLRHAAEVEAIWITPLPGPLAGGAKLTAFLSGGKRYETNFASLEVCEEWVKRPSLRHAEVTLCSYR